MTAQETDPSASDPHATESMALDAKVSDYILARLRDWGVTRVYGYAGDGINGLIGAFGRAGNAPEFVQPAHEELCALMATAHAKYTGQVGVCMATQGPGAIHLLNGLYDAKLDHQPVLAIVGQVSRSARGSSFMQEVDLVTLFKDVAHEFVEVLSTPEQARHLLDRAMRIALSERTVTALIVPHDVQRLEAAPVPERKHGRVFSSLGHVAPRVVPHDRELERAAELLNNGKRIAILVGAGALHATDSVVAMAERLGAGVAKALLGKGVLPDDLPFVTGSVGWLGTRASSYLMKACDTLLIVGSSFPYTEFLPEPGQARCVQIDIDGRAIGTRYPAEVHLVGDSRDTLDTLMSRLRSRDERPFFEDVKREVAAWNQELETIAQSPANPIHPAKVFFELSRQLPDLCALCGDSGSATYFFAQFVKLRRGMTSSLSGTLATMGSAIPYALAAKLNHPDRPAVAYLGDGAMQMSGLNALITVAQRYREWPDPRFVILVLNNGDLNYVTWEQRVMEGDPRFAPSQNLFDFDYTGYAKLLGLEALKLTDPTRVEDAWKEAFAAKKPFLLEVVVDPRVPTLPIELTEDQQQNLKRAFDAEERQ
jgi:pyruvate dehydrogenase (quinone)